MEHYPVIEYSNFRGVERRNVQIPEHIRASVEKRNAAVRNRRVPVNVPAVPELTAAEHAELIARTNAVIGL